MNLDWSSETMAAQTEETLAALVEQIAVLEKSSWSESTRDVVVDITPELRRARRHVQQKNCFSSSWKHCPSNYYSLGLDERKVILGAKSTSQLCKACLFENKNYKPNENVKKGEIDPTNSKYYLIVVQYVESINMKKLALELRGLCPAGPTRFDPNYFVDMRLASEEDNAKLTGYPHNGVSPFGMLEKTIPIVLCKSIMNVRPKFIWMGGGHPDWKLGMAVSEFVQGLNAIVLDISEPREL